MGNANGCFECFEVPNYIIYVKTGDTKGAGLHNAAEITLINELGEESHKLHLNGCCVTVFKKGRTDSFKVRKVGNFGTIKRIIIEQNKEQEEVEWFIEKIIVRHINEESEGDTIFPIHRWLRNKPLSISEYDSSLPQNDLSAEQRASEISMKRSIYGYRKSAEYLPAQVNVDFFYTLVSQSRLSKLAKFHKKLRILQNLYLYANKTLRGWGEVVFQILGFGLIPFQITGVHAQDVRIYRFVNFSLRRIFA